MTEQQQVPRRTRTRTRSFSFTVDDDGDSDSDSTVSSFTTTVLLDNSRTVESSSSFSIDQDHEYRMLCKETEELTKQQKEITKQHIESTKQKRIVLEIYKEKVKLLELKMRRRRF